MPRLALVVNPFASRVSDDRLDAVVGALRRAGEVSVIPTERPQHATDLVSRADADAVVIFSGDGGFNEALNGLRDEMPIGFLPGGGTSVLSRALGLPADPVAAAVQIADALAHRTHAPHRRRPGERPTLRLLCRRRARRRCGARRRSEGARERRKASG